MFVSAFALALACAGIACGPADDGRPVRIVLITLDTLRWDSFAGRPEMEGAAAGEMPRLRELAARGQVFEQFYAATSTTQPTHASLFTGLHAWQHGVQRNGAVLAESHSTLAERLQSEGFATGAVVASFPLDGRFGFEQGFDHYDDEFTMAVPYPKWEGEELEQGRFYSLAQRVTRRGLRLIGELEGPRQFLWLHYYDPHEPYGDNRSPEDEHEVLPIVDLYTACSRRAPDLTERLVAARRLYDHDVSVLDSSLARIFARLEQDADRYETHVVVTADHGESFGEDGSIGHGKRLTREQVHVPTVIVSSRAPAGTRSDVAGTVDLFTTVLALAGIDDEGGIGHDLLAGERAGAGLAFGMRRTFATPYADLRTDGSTVVVRGSRFFSVKDGRIYAGDSGEVHEEDVAALVADEGVAGPMRTLFESFESALRGSETTELQDEETLEALRALGYTH